MKYRILFGRQRVEIIIDGKKLYFSCTNICFCILRIDLYYFRMMGSL